MAAGSDHRPAGDDAPPHLGWLPASDCAQHAQAALPSASRFRDAGSNAFVLDHPSTVACCCCGYLSLAAPRAHGSAQVLGLIAPGLQPTALAGLCSLLPVVLFAPLLSWLHYSSLGNPS